jgi:hypothetical protein
MKATISIIIGAFLWLAISVNAADSDITKTFGEQSAIFNAAYVYTNIGSSYWRTNFVPRANGTMATNVTVFTTNDTKYVIMMKPFATTGYAPAGKIPYADLIKIYTTSNMMSVVTGYYKGSWKWQSFETFVTQIIHESSTVDTTNVYKGLPSVVWTNLSGIVNITNYYPIDALNVMMTDPDTVTKDYMVTYTDAATNGLMTKVRQNTQFGTNFTVAYTDLATNGLMTKVRENTQFGTNYADAVRTDVTSNMLMRLHMGTNEAAILALNSAKAYTVAYADGYTSNDMSKYIQTELTRAMIVASNLFTAAYVPTIAATNFGNSHSSWCTNSMDNMLVINFGRSANYVLQLTNLDWRIHSFGGDVYHLGIATNTFQVFTQPTLQCVTVVVASTQAAYGGDAMTSNRYLHLWVYSGAMCQPYDVNISITNQTLK